MIGYLAPGEIAYSILTTETEKEKPLKQLKDNLSRITDCEPSTSDSEQLKLEKSIVKAKREIEEGKKKEMKGEKLSEEELSNLIDKYYYFLPDKQRE